MKHFKALAGMLLAGAALMAQAEGSRSLYPSGYETAHTDGGRGNLDLQTNQKYLGKVSRRTFIYVYAKAGEHILYGSSNRVGINGAIEIYTPGSFGTKGDETIPTDPTRLADRCGNSNTGLIDTRDKETRGPQSVDANNNPLGYVPCIYQVPPGGDGIYGVLFSIGTGGSPSGSVATVGPSNVSAAAWDVTVRSSDISSIDNLDGRVFTYAWSTFTGGNGNGKRLYSDLYYVTGDGYRYKQSLKGIDPNGGTFFGNTYGFMDRDEPLYKDIRGTGAVVDDGSWVAAGVTAERPEFPLFFNDIQGNAETDAVLTALGIPLAPRPPQVNSFNFSYPPASSSTTYEGQGGVFSFYVTDTLSFQIVISHDGHDWNPATPLNRVLTGKSGTGPYSIVWDGKDNKGDNFPVGSGYQFRISGRNGEVHFPFVDVEGNFFGGPVVTKLNGNTPNDSTVYYDDRGYQTKSGLVVGTLNGHLCGAAGGEQPTPVQALLGVDSSEVTSGKYARYWTNAGNSNSDCVAGTQGFGDAKALNLWAYQATLPQSNTFNIITGVDVKATLSAPVSTTPGGTVTVNVGFGNVGSQTALTTTYQIQLPGGLSGVSCASATCSYDSGTGLVTVTGLPPSLTAGQTVNMSLSYTAPQAGNVPVTATVFTGSNQGANLAPDSASAITLVGGGSPNADVMTTVSASPSAVVGGQVAVPVSYANVGTSAAAITGYTLTLPSGLSGVSCVSTVVPGMSCNYDSGTGAVTVNGLPATLNPGDNLPFTLFYTAPAAGSAVRVQSVIATSATETNIINNTAQGITTTEGGVGSSVPDVITSLTAPPTATPGSQVEVPVRFGNVGDTAAAISAYTLTLPSSMNPASVSCPLPAMCAYNPGSGTVTVTGLPPTLAPGEWTGLTLRYTAPASGVVPVGSQISTSTPGEVVTVNNTDTGHTTVVTAATGADVAITVNPPAQAVPGAAVSVPVTATNLGPDNADGVSYRVNLTGSPTGVTVTYGGGACNYNAATGVVTSGTAPVCQLPATLTPGQRVDLVVGYTAPGAGTVGVTGTVSTTTSEANTANNVRTGTTEIMAGALTDVTTTISPPGSALAGSTVTVPVTFSNAGGSAATTVGYHVQLTGSPAGVTVTNGGVPCVYNSGTGVITGCGLPTTLNPGQEVNLQVQYTAPAVASTVTASSTVTTGSSESNTNNNTASAPTVVTLAPSPDMGVDVSNLPTTGTVGVNYSGYYTCTNGGTADALAHATTVCALNGTLPPGLGAACSINLPSAGTPWAQGSAVPRTAVVTCTVSGVPTGGGVFPVTGETSTPLDSNGANNARSTSITITTVPNLVVTPSLPPTATVNQPYSGSYTCANNGSANATGATGCTVSALPPGVTVRACTISPGGGAWSAGSTIPVGAVVTCRVEGSPTTTGTTPGIATAAASGVPSATAPYSITVRTAAPIPTLSQWGVLLLSGLMALMGLVRWRRL